MRAHLEWSPPCGPEGRGCTCCRLAPGGLRDPASTSPWLWAPPHPSVLLCPLHGTVGAVEGAPLSGGRSDPVPHVSSLSASCSSPSQRRLPRRRPVDRLSWGAGLARVHLETSLVSLQRETLRPGGGSSQAQSQPCEAQSMLPTAWPEPPLTLLFLQGWLGLQVVRALPSQGLAPCPLTCGLSPNRGRRKCDRSQVSPSRPGTLNSTVRETRVHSAERPCPHHASLASTALSVGPPFAEVKAGHLGTNPLV